MRRGHEVTLYASGESQTLARLVTKVDRACWHHQPRCCDFAAFSSVVLRRILREIDRFDVVHSHLECAGFPPARASGGPRREHPPRSVRCPRAPTGLPRVRGRSVAFDLQMPSAPACHRPTSWPTVYHGVDLGQFNFNPRSGNYPLIGQVLFDRGHWLARAPVMPRWVLRLARWPNDNNLSGA